jgi:hypothetical protein
MCAGSFSILSPSERGKNVSETEKGKNEEEKKAQRG